MTYEEALSFIHSTEWQGSRPGLNRITELMEKLGNPEKTLNFVHVAGTNGKGSFCAMLDSVLRKAGYKTGLFTSPYIEFFEERIRFDGDSRSVFDNCADKKNRNNEIYFYPSEKEEPIWLWVVGREQAWEHKSFDKIIYMDRPVIHFCTKKIGEKHTENMLIIEVMTIGDDFSLTFMQSGRGERYLDAFISEIRSLDIPVKLVGEERYNLCSTCVACD